MVSGTQKSKDIYKKGQICVLHVYIYIYKYIYIYIIIIYIIILLLQKQIRNTIPNNF